MSLHNGSRTMLRCNNFAIPPTQFLTSQNIIIIFRELVEHRRKTENLFADCFSAISFSRQIDSAGELLHTP